MESTDANQAAADEYLKLTSPQATGRAVKPQSAEEEASTKRGMHRGMTAALIHSGEMTLQEALKKLDCE